MSSTDGENQPDNTPLIDMNYDMVVFEECQKCKQFDPNYVKFTSFKNCGFSIEHIDKTTIQTFECTKCNFTWIRKYYYE